MKRTLMAAAVASLLAIPMAGPALANHDHQLHNPSGCHTIPVSHQAHGATDPGNKFHGAAHVGAATAPHPTIVGAFVLGQGNSVVYVKGGACS